jgi:hypothetical protein
VQKVGGKDIASDGKTAMLLINWAMALFDAIDPEEAAKEYRIALVLVSRAERDLPLKANIPLQEIRSNKTHTLYRVTE